MSMFITIEASTPFGKVATWVRETAKKTVRIFTSFRERFWRDDIEDQENEIYPPPVVYGSINMESQRQFDTVSPSNFRYQHFINI